MTEPNTSSADPAKSFAAAADIYERGRPPYPQAALDAMVPAGAHTALDLAAGTGKLTRQLLDRGLEVIAVEPLVEMLDQLRAAAPGADARLGSAEQIPLDDDSVDVVTVAQAWHWVDQPIAVPEVARVLRPGGRLGLIWNFRDSSAPWIAALERITDGPERSGAPDAVDLGDGFFTPIERREFHWVHHLAPERVRDMVGSRSYVIGLASAERERLLNEVDRLVATHPDLAGLPSVPVPYRTIVLRANVLR